MVRASAKQQIKDARNLYEALGFTDVPKGTRIHIDNVIFKPRNPRTHTHMCAYTKNLTKRLATVNTNDTPTSHANTSKQIPKS